MIDIFFLCLAFGCFSGILAGLFGVGGGLVLVPFFLFLFAGDGVAEEYLMLMAIATSLATMIVTSVAATLMQQRLGAVIWKTVFALSYGIVMGVIIGAWLADLIAPQYLRICFALYMLYAAMGMLLASNYKVEYKPLSRGALKLSGLIIGFASSVLGIGGGSLTVPLLAKHQLPMRNAVAVSSACGLPIAVIGTITYVYLGWHKIGLPEGSVGYVYLPAFIGVVSSSMLFAPIGAKLANRLATQLLKRFFSLLLFLVAGKLLWPVWTLLGDKYG